MKYYAHFGHKDFILCLGYKGNVIKDYFLHYDESVSNDFVWSQGGKNIQFLNRDIDDWTITFVETGANVEHRPTSESRRAVPAGRRDVPRKLWRRSERRSASAMLDTFRSEQRGSIAVAGAADREFRHRQARRRRHVVTESAPLTQTDIWINGGFFVMRNEIFDHIQPGEELVREPFQRLIEKQALLAYKYNGFWQCMDTFKDKQRLEELNQGRRRGRLATGYSHRQRGFARRRRPEGERPPTCFRSHCRTTLRLSRARVAASAEQLLWLWPGRAS